MKLERKITCHLAIIVFICTIWIFAGSLQAADMQVTVDLPSKDGRPTVKKILNGKSYSTNSWFSEMVAGADPDEQFVMRAIATNKSSDTNEIKGLWAPDEKNHISKFLADSQAVTRNQSFYKRVKDSAFIAKIIYENYEVFLIQHNVEGFGGKVKAYPVKKSNGRFYLTNNLSNDPVFSYLAFDYAKSLPLKKR